LKNRIRAIKSRRDTYSGFVGKLMGRDYLQDLDIDVRACTAVIWLRIGASFGLL